MLSDCVTYVRGNRRLQEALAMMSGHRECGKTEGRERGEGGGRVSPDAVALLFLKRFTYHTKDGFL